MVRKKWLSLYYTTYECYIHQSCTKCSFWHDLLMLCGGLCLWPTFHAWVTMVRKKWLSPYYSTYECYIHQSCTKCSSWHYLHVLMPHGGLCPWPTFHASVTKPQSGNSGAPVMVPITIMSSLAKWLILLHGLWRLIINVTYFTVFSFLFTEIGVGRTGFGIAFLYHILYFLSVCRDRSGPYRIWNRLPLSGHPVLLW